MDGELNTWVGEQTKIGNQIAWRCLILFVENGRDRDD